MDGFLLLLILGTFVPVILVFLLSVFAMWAIIKHVYKRPVTSSEFWTLAGVLFLGGLLTAFLPGRSALLSLVVYGLLVGFALYKKFGLPWQKVVPLIIVQLAINFFVPLLLIVAFGGLLAAVL